MCPSTNRLTVATDARQNLIALIKQPHALLQAKASDAQALVHRLRQASDDDTQGNGALFCNMADSPLTLPSEIFDFLEHPPHVALVIDLHHSLDPAAGAEYAPGGAPRVFAEAS